MCSSGKVVAVEVCSSGKVVAWRCAVLRSVVVVEVCSSGKVVAVEVCSSKVSGGSGGVQ